jgi:hypothetical protein
MAKTTQYTYNTLSSYPINTLGSITYILKLVGVYEIPLPKPKSKAIPCLRHSVNTMG